MLWNFNVKSSYREELIDITDKVNSALKESGVKNGVAVIFVPHTTAAVTINENADPDVVRDISGFMSKLVPHGERMFRHMEGNSDSHIKSSMFGFLRKCYC